MNATHTPGPWEVHPTGLAVMRGQNCVAEMGDMSETENRANAALIAAAPDAMAVCRMVAAHYEGLDYTNCPGFVLHARAAVAKAEGR